jgi:hypothetical protein
VRTNQERHQIEQLIAGLSHGRAQTVPALTKPSDSTANAIEDVVRLLT